MTELGMIPPELLEVMLFLTGSWLGVARKVCRLWREVILGSRRLRGKERVPVSLFLKRPELANWLLQELQEELPPPDLSLLASSLMLRTLDAPQGREMVEVFLPFASQPLRALSRGEEMEREVPLTALAARRDFPRLLDWLVRAGSPFNRKECFGLALKSEAFQALNWLQDHYGPQKWIRSFLPQAVRKERLKLLDWFLERGYLENSPLFLRELVMEGVKGNAFESLDWFHLHFSLDTLVEVERIFHHALHSGNKRLFHWAMELWGEPKSSLGRAQAQKLGFLI